MERETLVALLDRDGDADKACRNALLEGADLRTSENPVPVSELIGTYTVREAITRETGIPTLGYPDALHSLRGCDLEEVLLWGVTQIDPPYYFQLFMSADAERVIACIGVSQDPRFRRTSPLET
jgi:hypothetical protein